MAVGCAGCVRDSQGAVRRSVTTNKSLEGALKECWQRDREGMGSAVGLDRRDCGELVKSFSGWHTLQESETAVSTVCISSFPQKPPLKQAARTFTTSTGEIALLQWWVGSQQRS